MIFIGFVLVGAVLFRRLSIEHVAATMTLAPSPTETRMRKILVADRRRNAFGSWRTCRRLGIEAVAVYSESDAGSAHVQAADVAVPIGPGAPRSSYLSAEKLVEAARLTRADAVIRATAFSLRAPRSLRRSSTPRLVWIGPRPETIAAMGDKGRARTSPSRRARARPPRQPAVRRDHVRHRRRGGGDRLSPSGEGRRRGRRDRHAPRELSRTTLRGGAGDTRDGAPCLRQSRDLSRRVRRARTPRGNTGFRVWGRSAIHFYERDCSLQRRFQKVIEESPAPALPEALQPPDGRGRPVVGQERSRA